ncbi:MAG TPA: hypothetical protein VFZ34_18125 [Blastocatellia bacterium]|nr:hypothetical protein [Blastocatellia bacterium]
MKKEVAMTADMLTQRGKEIEAILREAGRQAILMHKKLGNPIATWQDGKVVIVPPEEIPIDDDEPTK